ncbi:uncharacterized protein LOC125590176 isoform X2 [Brassica napus]|uniref:uncharacterized protein LOC125590176 isoform X2 n=1 Tax=Brassica napus TaxID=3708 RepID=UPI00207AAEB4|nr:uncharacterized protein LOC125590176 isoform X2 [Brassica napus]
MFLENIVFHVCLITLYIFDREMSTSDCPKTYPKRLYEEGKCPLQHRSMNHSCHLASLQMVEESVGIDAWESIKESAVGVILRFKDLDYTWSAQAVHHLLTNQLVVDSIHEVWSLIEGQPIRFSLHEFGEITGLNCEPFNIDDKVEVDHKPFWEEMGVSAAHGPMLSELRSLLPRIKNWPFEKRRMIGLLCVLSVGILGISPGSRIPLEAAKRVLDAEAFERYPWGRVGFSSLVNSIKIVSFGGKKKYTLRGCVHALLIWLYESIPGIGHEYGNHIEGNQVPLLSWSGSRCRIQWGQFYEKEKKVHQKVRVRHLVVKAEADIYPQWDDHKVDDDLHNMILDILHEQLDDKHWSLKAANEPVANKKKRNFVSEEDDCMKKKNPAKRTTTASGSSLNSGGDDGFKHALMEAVKTLTATVQNMDTVVAEKVLTAVDTKIDTKINARVGQTEQVLGNQISILQEEIAKIREQMQTTAPKNDADVQNQEDEVNSNDPSWMVQDKTPYDADAVIQCVVRKKANKSKVKLTSPILLDTDGVKVAGKNQVKKPAGCLKKVKKEKNVVPQLRDSTGTWSDSEEKKKYCTLDATLDQLAASILDGPLQKRKPQLTKTQVYPYVGNSTVKRIISGVSEAHYDPLAKVAETKFKKLMDYLRSIGDKDVETPFYMKLIKPRNVWETDDFGWLTDSHMASAMLMFHKRYMRNPSPYSSDRIAFLEHWFVKMWVRDYKKYDPQTWEFSETYKKVFNGNYPSDFSNNRKWVKDVDRLFFCHLINGNHWVALEVDFEKKLIHVYDSIQTVVPSNTDLQEECRSIDDIVKSLITLSPLLPQLHVRMVTFLCQICGMNISALSNSLCV